MVRRTLTLVTFATVFALGPAAAEAGVPKDDWPRINGELWINGDDHDASHSGTAKNDELLGGHGGAGDDAILYVSKTQNKKVERRNCERVMHKSAKDAVDDRNGLYD